MKCREDYAGLQKFERCVHAGLQRHTNSFESVTDGMGEGCCIHCHTDKLGILAGDSAFL